MVDSYETESLPEPLEGRWVISGIGSEAMYMDLKQTGRVAIGTLEDAPVIVNITDEQFRFKCDRKDEKGRRVRYMFEGQITEPGLSGKALIHRRGEGTLKETEWSARKVD